MSTQNYTNDSNDSKSTPPFHPTDIHQAETFMNSERALTPKMVSSLLNVNVLLQSERTHSVETTEDSFSILSAVFTFFIAIVIAVAVGTAFLYTQEIGPFYNRADAVMGL